MILIDIDLQNLRMIFSQKLKKFVLDSPSQ